MIHPLTNINSKARIAAGVTVESFTTISGDVEIGEGTWIGPNVTIMDGARIGKNCRIFPGAVISAVPQDLKYKGLKIAQFQFLKVDSLQTMQMQKMIPSP